MADFFKKIFSQPKLVITAVGIIALAIGGVSTLIHTETLKNIFQQQLPVATTTVNGEVSSKYLTLAFPVGGRIKNVSVKIGDQVVAGQVLASLDAGSSLGSINQAEAAYTVAQTNYDKLVNGASTPDKEVSQAAVASATTALANAKQNLLRDLTLAYNNVNTAVLSNTNGMFSNPETASPQFYIAGTMQTSQQLVSDINNQRVEVNTALRMWSDETSDLDQGTVIKTVKNTTSYIVTSRAYLSSILSVLTSYTQISASGNQSTVTAYQNSVISAKTAVDAAYTTITNDVQMVNSAQAALDQANAALALKQAPARAEDLAIAKAQVESTQGALQIAQAAYDNTIITAPVNGTILSVVITAGQIASANTTAIEMSSK